MTEFLFDRRSFLVAGGSLPAGTAMESVYTVTDMGGRSRVDVVTGCELQGLWRLFAPLMRCFAGGQQKSSFKA